MFKFFLHTLVVLFSFLTVFSVNAQSKVVVIPLFGGDDIAQCEAITACDAGQITVRCPSGDQQTSCSVPKRVFLTSSRHTGALGGLKGADAICQRLADSNDLFGVFKAWLSDSAASPSTRFTQNNAPYVRIDGALIANDYADLTDGNILNRICVYENGDTSRCEQTNTLRVWTSTFPDGTFGTERHCSDWSVDANRNGLFGEDKRTDAEWSTAGGINAPTAINCNQEQALYCFEQ